MDGCIACGSGAKERFLDKDGYRIVRCGGCGLGWVDPVPDREAIARFYRDHQDLYCGSYPAKERSKLRDARREIFRIRRLLGRRKDVALLDIGCSCGFLLKVAGDAGWAASGTDISEREIAYARTRYRVNAVQAQFPESLPFESGTFDVITMFDVLEHLVDPTAGLRECRRLLADGGLLVVGTPDFGHRRAVREGRNWGHLKPPEHLFYFTTEALAGLTRQAGFSSRGSYLKVPWRDGLKAVFQKVDDRTIA